MNVSQIEEAMKQLGVITYHIRKEDEAKYVTWQGVSRFTSDGTYSVSVWRNNVMNFADGVLGLWDIATREKLYAGGSCWAWVPSLMCFVKVEL